MQARRPGNLAADITPLIGRAAEVADGVRLLGEARLVTVTGAPGVGKSRVGAQIARLSRRRFPDGVWQIELSSVPAGSCPAALIAAVLGPRDGARPDPRGHAADSRVRAGTPAELTRVVEALRGLRALLVLDTCEHVVEGVALLAEALLRRAPRIGVLATSRRPLGVPGERLLAVPPLPIPEAGGPDASGGDVRAADDAGAQGGAAAPASPAVQLFAERAAAVDPAFAPTPEALPAVADICRRLDGIPLAIELAAARLRSLSAHELLDRLADPFEVLGASRSRLARHRDMRAAIAWSHELCDPAGRALWSALSVFDGPFDLETAERVLPLAAQAVPGASAYGGVAGVLAALVDASVVLREAGDYGMRYRLPFLHAEFARGRAGGGPAVRIRIPEQAPSPERGGGAGGAVPEPGGPPAVDRADRREAASAPGPSTPGPEPAEAAGRPSGAAPPLSPRELQVAELIVEGMTNRQIAVELGIAKRTVDAHVRNILTKASLASRTQVAAWVAERHHGAGEATRVFPAGGGVLGRVRPRA
ncbi:Predicted ATPase [Sinosporangium album]|uniref:Predicted ATPase n=1 Tax=Sinosporangium album TaxID=504805 RepID=A0A1G7XF50_9ACTN|nr:LuxR C-terminal-related transcriptional regulator [Sinosporangium album]SDG82829.1 Predicted ATPase [Sinosporangium album]